jgi:hypothetical protein
MPDNIQGIQSDPVRSNQTHKLDFIHLKQLPDLTLVVLTYLSTEISVFILVVYWYVYY